MLRLPPFEYRRASTVAEAIDCWSEADGPAMYVAGGTDLLPNMKRRQFEPATLISIRQVAELQAIEGDAQNGDLCIGGGVALRRVAESAPVRERCTALAQAAEQVASLQIQRLGTIGGNLCVDTRCNYYNQTYEWRRAAGFCLKKDGDICLVAPGSSKCWAISSSDTAPALIALGASVELAGPVGMRTIPLPDLYRDDGIDYLTRQPGEILTRVRVPAAPGMRSTYLKVRRRGSFDFPLLGVAAAMRLRHGKVTAAQVVLGAVHTHPVQVPEAAEILVGAEPTDERIEAVAEAAHKRATPLDNADLMYYWRKRVTRVNVRRALEALRSD